MGRLRDHVMPKMKEVNDLLAGRVARECRKAGKGYEEYMKELKSQVSGMPRLDLCLLHRL